MRVLHDATMMSWVYMAMDVQFVVTGVLMMVLGPLVALFLPRRYQTGLIRCFQGRTARRAFAVMVFVMGSVFLLTGLMAG